MSFLEAFCTDLSTTLFAHEYSFFSIAAFIYVKHALTVWVRASLEQPIAFDKALCTICFVVEVHGNSVVANDVVDLILAKLDSAVLIRALNQMRFARQKLV